MKHTYMEKLKRMAMTVALCPLSVMPACTPNHPVYAAESDGGLGFDVDEFYDETVTMFSEMKSGYQELAANYGNVGAASAESVYMDYLQNLQKANEDSAYSEKLAMIQDMDISINDPVINASYNKAKGQVNNALTGEGFDVQGRPSSFATDANAQSKATYSMMASASEGAKKYSSIVKDFKDKGSNIESFTGADLKETLQGGSPLTASSQSKASFKDTQTIFQMVNSSYDIDSMAEEYGVRDASQFATLSRSRIQSFVGSMTEDGEPLSAKQEKEYTEAMDNLSKLDAAIKSNDQGNQAVYMSKVKNYLTRHKIRLSD